VLSTRGHAEGSAIGYNRQRKGARSYYPLFSTIAQTGQFLDLLHRPGNVHDSRDALAFIEANIEIVRAIVGVREIETRMDGAFFSEDIAKKLVDLKARSSRSPRCWPTISVETCRCPPKIASDATPRSAPLAGRSRLSTPFVTSFCVLVASRVQRAS
jgi:hypothetical protein